MPDKTHELQKVMLYSDGACRGNPGPGGYGTILHYMDSKNMLHERTFSEGYENTTNNRMEIMGIIAGLSALKKPCQVEIFTDSQYVVNTFEKKWINKWQRNGWKNTTGPVKNVDLWKDLLRAMDGHKVHFHWLKGHAGHEYNEKCDDMAKKAASGAGLLYDAGLNDN